MDKYSKRVSDRLHQCGAELYSTRRHRKWRLPDGQKFIQPSTPSDWRSSRKQDSVLKRLVTSAREIVREEQVEDVDAPAAVNDKPRFRQPNNPQHTSGDFRMPKLESSMSERTQDLWQFCNIEDLLTVIDEIPEYWVLDSCGRVRVLMKMAATFAHKIEVFTTFGVIHLLDEVNLDGGSPYVMDNSPRAKSERDIKGMMRFYREWGGTAGPGENWCKGLVGLPCLRVYDPQIGDVVIETSLSGLLLGVEKTEAFSGLVFSGGCALASLPQWEDYRQAQVDAPNAFPYPHPDRGYLTFMFVDPGGMKRKGIRYRTCSNWVEPSVSRKVIQKIYEWSSQSERVSVEKLRPS